MDCRVGLPHEGVQRAPELGAGPADETGLEIGGLGWGGKQNLLSLQLQWPGRLAYPRPLPVKQHEGCPLVMLCLAVCSGVNISCRGILKLSGGFVKVRAYWKKRLLQFSDYFPSLSNEAAAHELQKMGMEEQKEGMYFCCTAFYCRSGSVQCHVCLLASLPLHVLSRFLLSDSSVVRHSYRLVSVVLLFYHFVSFPHRDLQSPISLMSTHPQMQTYPLHVTFFPLSVDISPVLFAHYLWLPFLFNPIGRANLILRESKRI